MTKLWFGRSMRCSILLLCAHLFSFILFCFFFLAFYCSAYFRSTSFVWLSFLLLFILFFSLFYCCWCLLFFYIDYFFVLHSHFFICLLYQFDVLVLILRWLSRRQHSPEPVWLHYDEAVVCKNVCVAWVFFLFLKSDSLCCLLFVLWRLMLYSPCSVFSSLSFFHLWCSVILLLAWLRCVPLRMQCVVAAAVAWCNHESRRSAYWASAVRALVIARCPTTILKRYTTLFLSCLWTILWTVLAPWELDYQTWSQDVSWFLVCSPFPINRILTEWCLYFHMWRHDATICTLKFD